MEKCSVRCHLADKTRLMTTSSLVFSGLFIPLNNSCCEISLIDPICLFEVSTYYVLCGRFNRVEERIFGIRQNKQVCKLMHLSAVKKQRGRENCMFEAFPVVQPCGCAIICSLCHVSSCFSWLSAASFLRWTDLHQQLFSSCLVVVFVAVTITNHGTWEHPDTAETRHKNPEALVCYLTNHLIIFDHFQILKKASLIPANFPFSLPSCLLFFFVSLYPGDHCIPAVSLLSAQAPGLQS